MSLNRFKHWLRFLNHRLFGRDGVYVHKVRNDAPWALVCYIPYVFYLQHKTDFMNQHQSQWEAVKIDEVLTSLGYNTYHLLFSESGKLPDIDFKMVFGLEPAFCEACEKYPNAKKIYYATGAYVGHQNYMVKSLTDRFNCSFGSTVPHRRTAPENNAAFLADEILQIGSSFTIETYPNELQNKVHLIHQSTQATSTLNVIGYACENEYLFMSSSGNILKGVPQVVECFSKHPDTRVHIVGPIEEDVKEALSDLITPNVIMHGFMNVNSAEFLDIVKRCNFTIYPSASEGGVPGGVLNCMKNGLIPIVSKWSAFDEIDEYGFILDDISADAIDRGLNWSHSLDRDTIVKLKHKCSLFVEETYNLNRFGNEFQNYINNVMAI